MSRWQVANDGTTMLFETATVAETADTITYMVQAALMDGASYQWRVRAVRQGFVGPWSVWATFRTPFLLQSVEISGTTTFQALGVTSQLAAIARYADGSSQDVSNQSVWDSADAGVVAVSGTGLLTTVGFGAAEVSARFGELTTAAVVTVVSPCTMTLAGSATTFNRHGGTGTVDVQAGAGCFWSTTSDVDWLALVATCADNHPCAQLAGTPSTVSTAAFHRGQYGEGPGTVTYVVDPLANGSSRTGRITIGEESIVIQQENTEGAEPPFRYYVTPESRTASSYGGSYTVTVTPTRPDAQWTATSDQPWLVITTVSALSPAHEGTPGTGAAAVTYRVEENPLNVERTGTISVEGLSHQNPPAVHTVKQRGKF